MNAARRILVVVGITIAAVAATARGANMEITTAGISLGAAVSGPTIPADGLTGRVVVLEFWGVNCPPCIASMPGLEDLHRRLGPQGLVVVGAHAQGGHADEVRNVVNHLGVTFPIVENATVEGGMDFSGIPHCMVFDHTGKCVFRGSPGDAHDVVLAAVQSAPAAILAGRSLAKLAQLGQILKNEAMCGNVLKRATSMLESPDAETAEEARYVVDRIEGRGRAMLEEARSLKESDPAAASAVLQRCVAAFKGSAIGTDAGALLQEWRKDKDFQSAIKAGQQVARLEALQAAAQRAPGGVPPQIRSQALEIVKGIEKGWPGSAAAARAAEILAALERDGAAAP